MPALGQQLAFIPLAQTSDAVDAVANTAIYGFIAVAAISALLMLVAIAGLWATFGKAGVAGWKSLIPIYNAVLWLKMANKPAWWVLLLICPVVNLVFGILVSLEVAKTFGRGPGFGIGLAFLPFVFYPILGWGGSEYQTAFLVAAEGADAGETRERSGVEYLRARARDKWR